MEDTLREINFNMIKQKVTVLILVLMEDTLRDIELWRINSFMLRLNPCFNGRYSQRYVTT